eukprot:247884-Pelagomonas_calceolata.AAC.3
MEVCLLQPMMAFKNAMQEGRPIPRNPIQIYRGLTPMTMCHPKRGQTLAGKACNLIMTEKPEAARTAAFFH